MFSACRNCPRSAIQAQEEVLDPCCEPYAQLAFTFVSFLHWIKESVGLDEQRLITKSFAGCFLLPVEGSQSSLTSLWTSLASCKSLSLVNLVRPLHWFWWFCAGNSHSAETFDTDSGHGRVNGSGCRPKNRADSIQHTCNVKIWFIYLLFS